MPSAKINFNNTTLNASIITGLWLIFFLIHLNLYGIVSTLEADKYINEANNIIDHKGLSALRFWFYSVTIAIITISLKLKMGLAGAVIIQALFNLWVILYFFKSLRYILTSQISPLVISCLLIMFSPYSSWNVFLYTESVFYSCILLLTATLIRHSYNKNLYSTLFVIVALAITILARPLGMLFVPGVVFYFYTCLSRKTKLIILPIALIAIAISIYSINIIFTTTTDATITLSAQQGCVVCGIFPETNTTLNLIENVSPLHQLYYYITHNFSHFITLAIKRLNAFFLMTRPYFSASHNLFLLAFVIPLYILSLISLLLPKEITYRPMFYFMMISILVFAITIMLQCDDYHNRFVLGLFPFFLIFSGKTIENLISKRKNII